MTELEELKSMREKFAGVQEYWTALDWAINQIEKRSINHADRIRDAIDEIINDIKDRRGLKVIWAEIDDETQNEIKNTWASIICNALESYQSDGWISVKDRLPEKDDAVNNLVLAWSSELEEPQVERPDYVCSNNDDYTHWMPLPPCPKGRGGTSE